MANIFKQFGGWLRKSLDDVYTEDAEKKVNRFGLATNGLNIKTEEN